MSEPVAKDELGLSSQRLIAAVLVRLLFGFLALFSIAVGQGLHFGFAQRDYLFLALGAAVSIICVFAYGCVGIARANGRKKHLWMLFAICSGWLPYLFVMYVIFYRGVWAFVHLFSAFSWSASFGALVFIILGLFTMRHLQKLTDVVRIIRESIEA
ncbi:MAG: hypothetical protein JWQ71_3059 [Pedosphaera sp.]|nr:hypothetical protein [Pedosphaera sp.]